MWHSLVARIVRDDEAAGSNPVTPTTLKSKDSAICRVLFCCCISFKRLRSYAYPKNLQRNITAADFSCFCSAKAIVAKIDATQKIFGTNWAQASSPTKNIEGSRLSPLPSTFLSLNENCFINGIYLLDFRFFICMSINTQYH